MRIVHLAHHSYSAFNPLASGGERRAPPCLGNYHYLFLIHNHVEFVPGTIHHSSVAMHRSYDSLKAGVIDYWLCDNWLEDRLQKNIWSEDGTCEFNLQTFPRLFCNWPWQINVFTCNELAFHHKRNIYLNSVTSRNSKLWPLRSLMKYKSNFVCAFKTTYYYNFHVDPIFLKCIFMQTITHTINFIIFAKRDIRTVMNSEPLFCINTSAISKKYLGSEKILWSFGKPVPCKHENFSEKREYSRNTTFTDFFLISTKKWLVCLVFVITNSNLSWSLPRLISSSRKT